MNNKILKKIANMFFERNIRYTERPGWNKYFMDIAFMISSRSPDPKKKVGAIIVDDTNRIISTGYNALPAGFPESNIDWTNRELVKTVIIHAESNALLYSASRYKDATMYITLSPCAECLKLIKASGINTIYYYEKYTHFDNTSKTAELFGIELIQIK